MRTLDRSTKGVIPIVPTPFEDDGKISQGSIGALVDYYEGCGAIGLTILGVMGEAQKLSWQETLDCTDEFLRQAAGRLPVVVGVTGPSLAASAELALRSVDHGAAGVMLQPMTGLREDKAVVGYFREFIDGTAGKVPVCVQDYPTASGVHLSLGAWSELSAIPQVFMLKHEPFPGLQKLSAIREAEVAGKAERVSILTSNNAMHLPQELERGADGAMVGVAFTDLIVRICDEYRTGNRDFAFDLYDALLPLVRHENQAQFGLAIRKEILRKRGALRSAFVRYPGAILSSRDHAELDRLLVRLKRALATLNVTVDIGKIEPAVPV